MKRFRKVIFWCHLLAGSFAGLVVLVMSVTGVLLTTGGVVRWEPFSSQTSGRMLRP